MVGKTEDMQVITPTQYDGAMIGPWQDYWEGARLEGRPVAYLGSDSWMHVSGHPSFVKSSAMPLKSLRLFKE